MMSIFNIAAWLSRRSKAQEIRQFEDGFGWAMTQLWHYRKPSDEIRSYVDPSFDEWNAFDDGVLAAVRKFEGNAEEIQFLKDTQIVDTLTGASDDVMNVLMLKDLQQPRTPGTHKEHNSSTSRKRRSSVSDPKTKVTK